MKLSTQQARSLANKVSQEINSANSKKKNDFIADKTNPDFLKIQKTERYKLMVKIFSLGVITSVTMSSKTTDGIYMPSYSVSNIESLDRGILQNLYHQLNLKRNCDIYRETVLDDINIATIEADDMAEVITVIKSKYLN